MRKNSHIGLILFIVIILAAAGGAAYWYVRSAAPYETIFLEGTFINGSNVGNMTAEEVEEEIRSRVENYSLTLFFADGARENLTMEDIGFGYASDGKVAEILASQNPYEWIRGKLGQTKSYTVGEAYTFDEDRLREALFSLPEMKPENQTDPVNARMQMGEGNHLTIIPENDGSRIDGEKVFSAVKDAVRSGAAELDVTALDACSHADVRADDPRLLLQVSDLNSYLDEEIVYTMYDGSQIVLNRDTMAPWLSVSSDDPNYPDFYYFDVDKVKAGCREFVAQIASSYDYVKDSVIFHSSWQGDIEMACSDYGRVIDQEAESEALYNAILTRTSATLTPHYSLERDADGTFGGTYVEVDIEGQHMWYYRDGELWLDSDVVTGKGSDPSRRTPKGVFDIYTKERGRTLKGEINPSTGQPSYESYVNYWMPFYEGVGLHDATWRGSFGGSIYWDSGSHGCVNMPYSKAGELYEMVEVGTPVIVI